MKKDVLTVLNASSVSSLQAIVYASNQEARESLIELGFQVLSDVPQLLHQPVSSQQLTDLFSSVTEVLSSSGQATSRFHVTQSLDNPQKLLIEFLKAQPIASLTQAIKHAWFLRVLLNQNLFFAYQPIFDLATGEAIAYECLARAQDEDGKKYRGQDLIEAAIATNLTSEFDQIALMLCLKSIATLNNDSTFFVNILPNTIVQTVGLLEKIQQIMDLGIQPEKIVFELTEVEALIQNPKLLIAVNKLRDRGFKIAIDDLCSRVSLDHYFLDFRPDIVKIDRQMIQGCSHSPLKQIMLKSLLDSAHALGSVVVAEGLENLEDIKFCRQLGIDRGQGYGLAMPEVYLSQEPMKLGQKPIPIAS